MNHSAIQKAQIWISIGVAALIAAIGLSLRIVLQSADRWLASFFMKIPDAFTDPNLPLTYCVLWLLAAASLFIGLWLARTPRLYALAQLFAIVTLSQYVLGLNSGRPFSTLAVVALGGLTGYVFRLEKLRLDRVESQRYELLLRNQELQNTRLQMVNQDEVERRTLAADLQEHVLKDLKQLAGMFDDYAASRDQALVADIERLLKQSMDEVREAMDSLSPSALEHLGLAAAIEDCVRRGGQRAKFKVRFKNNADDKLIDRLSSVEQALLCRLVQEAVTNVCQHAEAKVVKVTMSSADEAVEISILDDGKGMQQDGLPAQSRGLRYMRQRADLIGATIAWQAGDDGKGTAVTIRFNPAQSNDDQSSHS